MKMTCLALSVAFSLGNAIRKCLGGIAMAERLVPTPAAVQAEGVPVTKMTGMMKIMTLLKIDNFRCRTCRTFGTTTRFWEYPEATNEEIKQVFRLG